MKVTVSVILDDEAVLTKVITVDAGNNPLFWSQGFAIGAETAAGAVEVMMNAQYGEADRKGIHVVR